MVLTAPGKRFDTNISCQRQLIPPHKQEKVVTLSDEAFGLILVKNYIDKWKLIANKADEADKGLKEDEAAQAQPKKKQNNKIYMGYTPKSGVVTVSTVDG